MLRICLSVNEFTSLKAQIELLRRLVQHNIVDTAVQWPDLQSRDVDQLLYGATETGLFGSQQWGGMTADTVKGFTWTHYYFYMLNGYFEAH